MRISSVNNSQRSVKQSPQVSTMNQMNNFQLTPYHFSLLRSFKHAIDVTLDQSGERIGSMASGVNNFTIQGMCKRAANDIPENFSISYVDQFCADQGHQFLKADFNSWNIQAQDYFAGDDLLDEVLIKGAQELAEEKPSVDVSTQTDLEDALTTEPSSSAKKNTDANNLPLLTPSGEYFY